MKPKVIHTLFGDVEVPSLKEEHFEVAKQNSGLVAKSLKLFRPDIYRLWTSQDAREDLIDWGMFPLAKAAMKHDPNGKAAYSTYAIQATRNHSYLDYRPGTVGSGSDDVFEMLNKRPDHREIDDGLIREEEERIAKQEEDQFWFDDTTKRTVDEDRNHGRSVEVVFGRSFGRSRIVNDDADFEDGEDDYWRWLDNFGSDGQGSECQQVDGRR